MTGSALALGVALAFYLAGATALGANLFLRGPGLLPAGRAAAVLGALAHTAAIGLRCAEVKHAPFTTPGETLSLLAWMVALLYVAVEIFWRLSATGPFALGLAFLLVLLGAALGGRSASPAADPVAQDVPALLGSGAISLHIIATVAAMAAFALSFCCAALYLIAHHILKSKHGLSWLRRLPPLLRVEKEAFALVAVGFPLLTLGILAGIVRDWAGDLPSGWQTDPKALLAYIVWGVYGSYLLARMEANWPPVRTAYVLLVGLALCLLLLFVPSAAHRFG